MFSRNVGNFIYRLKMLQNSLQWIWTTGKFSSII